ncbi:hypothetical protein MGN70_002149 [Eutypa lata]|nr:hypothetical protein MGN70_002149 [Eutypa lata]
MASPQKPPPTPAAATITTTTTTTPEQQQKPPFENPFTHNVALGITPIAMFALFLPPRRLDMRQILLGGVAVWGTNQLVYDYSGRSFAQRFNSRMASMVGTELPEKAQRTQLLLRQERERRRQQQRDAEQLERLRQEAQALGLPAGDAELRGVLKERERERGQKGEGEGQGQGKKERGALEAIWMGDQDDDWKEKRDRREKEALSEGGGGYWGLIADQLAEVWSRGRKKELEAQAAEVKAKGDANEGKKP